jgi:hypothetical protein
MPFGWSEVAVEKYPVLCAHAGKLETALVHYKLTRSGGSMKLNIGSDKEIGPVAMRLGPFENKPEVSKVSVNGTPPQGSIEKSGDSWWVRFTLPSVPIGRR